MCESVYMWNSVKKFTELKVRNYLRKWENFQHETDKVTHTQVTMLLVGSSCHVTNHWMNFGKETSRWGRSIVLMHSGKAFNTHNFYHYEQMDVQFMNNLERLIPSGCGDPWPLTFHCHRICSLPKLWLTPQTATNFTSPRSQTETSMAQAWSPFVTKPDLRPGRSQTHQSEPWHLSSGRSRQSIGSKPLKNQQRFKNFTKPATMKPAMLQKLKTSST